MALADGANFGPYRIIGRLGRGGMATVYRAYEPGLDRYIALKVLPEDSLQNETAVKRFELEARAVARLVHPNIVPVLAFGIEDATRTPWMALQLIEGGSLASVLAKGMMAPRRAVAFLRGIASALDYAHGQGVLHRDVKPHNVLVGASDHSYLADFGLARILESSAVLSTTGTALGTPQYMAPEQALGQELDHRCDIYALGIVAYELLAGAPPFQADTPLAVLMKHVREPIPIPAPGRVAEPLLRPVLKALAKDRKDRWTTALAFVEALDGAAAETRPAQQPGPVMRPAPVQPLKTREAVRDSTPGRPRKCPECSLLNEPTAMVCDCGFNFTTGLMQPGSTGAEQVLQVAEAHRSVVRFLSLEILLSVAYGVASRSGAGGAAVDGVFALAVVVCACFMASRGYRLAEGLGLSAPILWATGFFIPCLGLFVLSSLSTRATEFCRRSGLQVGLLGPTRKSIETFRTGPPRPPAAMGPSRGRRMVFVVGVVLAVATTSTLALLWPASRTSQPGLSSSPPAAEPTGVPGRDISSPRRRSGGATGDTTLPPARPGDLRPTTASARPPVLAPQPKATATPTMGALQVRAVPWADITLDGGKVAGGRIPLSPGSHLVRLVHPDYQPIQRAVTIRAGQTTTLVIDFTEDGLKRR